MNILVTVASKHRGTGEIGEALAAALRATGLSVETRAPETVTSLDRFDAVILGSAVYAGRWMDSATRFTERFATELADRAYQPRVREHFMSGVRSGVNGTPTFFINGHRHDGPWDLESLTAAIALAAGDPEL